MAPTSPKARQAAAGEALVTEVTERYEQLRAVVLDGHPGGVGLGLGVLAGRGLAAWITVWQPAAPPPGCPIPAARTPHPPAGSASTSASTSASIAGSQRERELVNVLVAMTLVHV